MVPVVFERVLTGAEKHTQKVYGSRCYSGRFSQNVQEMCKVPDVNVPGLTCGFIFISVTNHTSVTLTHASCSASPKTELQNNLLPEL